MAVWQSPSTGSRPVPIGSRSHRSESPTGYSPPGCPQQSPPPLSQVLTNVADPGRALNALAQPHCKGNAQPRLSSPPPGVLSLLCTPSDISILRRHALKTLGAASVNCLTINREEAAKGQREQEDKRRHVDPPRLAAWFGKTPSHSGSRRST
jgi:hypothetical protein